MPSPSLSADPTSPSADSTSELPDGSLVGEYGDPPENGLRIHGNPEDLEKVYDYEPGGHHPVHLGDILHQRYKVLHKLGSGGFSNVWLCRDISNGGPRYVGLKIIMAEVSTPDSPELLLGKLIQEKLGNGPLVDLFCFPLDQFEVDGPNGVHYAFAYPVLGPRVSTLPKTKSGDPGVPWRELCAQATSAMAVLHEHGICHGDFRPANILTCLSGLDNLDEDELVNLLGSPMTTPVNTREGGPHDVPTAPQYLVYPLDWSHVTSADAGAILVTNKACITDFGESYKVSSPPLELGIPRAYASPEHDLEQKAGIPSDLWALACTIFEVRTQGKLFAMFEDELDEHLFIITTVLGKLPEPWWSETWEGRKDIFKDEVDESGRVVAANSNVAISRRPRSLREAIAPRYEGILYELNKHNLGNISDKEVDLLSDLLGRLLRYDPAERISAKEALEHDWFKFCEQPAAATPENG